MVKDLCLTIKLSEYVQMPSFFGAWPSNNPPDKGEQDLPNVPVEQQVREIDSPRNINLEDLHKSVANFKPHYLGCHKASPCRVWSWVPEADGQAKSISHQWKSISLMQKLLNLWVRKFLPWWTIHLIVLFQIFSFDLKKDSTHRIIVNFKPLNEFVDYHYFKMDTFRTALKLIWPVCFLASVDLKDAYYSISIAEEDRKFLMFEWKGKHYQFTCLHNSLSSAPRIFTKILMWVYAHLRSNRHTYGAHWWFPFHWSDVLLMSTKCIWAHKTKYTWIQGTLQVYPEDQSLCVFTHLKVYLQRKKPLRGAETKIFLSHTKPHQRASKDTISRWIRFVMADAGDSTVLGKQLHQKRKMYLSQLRKF